ncbi:hypothetical protein E1218_29840 [Kribbella turkmenica]|uniref:WD40 repeat domain-containing protein n=1 Tax=Kribbella turkmenica TaxID=2530375 RepID=A0A4R4WPU1_9ACTN|nr:hypothetical protein [Kribbella turkmenica]TDD16430.1 hypothetical protein E1218_29840 [Kribbella turkmenica]
MSDNPGDAVTLTVGDYSIVVGTQPPDLLGHYLVHAGLVDNFPATDDPSSVGYSYVAIGTGDWPELVVTQHFSPAGGGFAPGVLFVPDKAALFIGAGSRLLGYHRGPAGEWRLTFVDEADMGFWAWRQHGDVVLMSAELELAAWSTNGAKLWTTYVEPPWTYRLVGEDIHLDVMGKHSAFNKHTGPTRPSPAAT